MVFWPDLNIHIVLLRKLAKYCKYIWYILRTTDFLYWGYAIPVSAEAHCTGITEENFHLEMERLAGTPL